MEKKLCHEDVGSLIGVQRLFKSISSCLPDRESEKEKEDRKMREKNPNKPHPAPAASTASPRATIGRSGIIHAAELLALSIMDHKFAGFTPAGGEILSNFKRHSTNPFITSLL